MAYSGPSESAAGGGLGAQAAQAGQRQAAAVGGGGGRDELGMSERASGAATGVARAAGGPDPRQLATNRGERPERKPVSVEKAPGRNEPCPCGSGKKYKKCHGALG